MTDEINCPECRGRGIHFLGPGLTVKCGFCLGAGQVGGEHEPAEDAEPPPPPPVGCQPAVAESGLCGRCLNQKVITSLGLDEHENPTTLVTVPCPRCAS